MTAVYPIVIAVHASSGVLGFLVGLLLVIRPELARRALWLVRCYLGLLVVLVAGLMAAVALHWTTLSTIARLVDLGLVVLAAYTLFRGLRAGRLAAAAASGWRLRLIDDVGFTLISLFDGFVIVASIRAGAPMPLVIAVGAAGVVAGIVATNRLKARVESGMRTLVEPQRMGG